MSWAWGGGAYNAGNLTKLCGSCKPINCKFLGTEKGFSFLGVRYKEKRRRKDRNRSQ